jgi:two-component system sensor histidine kinase/response regulator
MEHRAKRILVVDDKPNNLSLVTSLLRPDYEVLLANNGERAIVVARENAPDLILLDIMMPGMSGFEVCAILKQNPATAEIPVIFLTARNDSDDFEKAYDIGAVDYTTKPINTKELIMRVKTHLLIAEQKNNLVRLNERITHINEELEEEVTKRTRALSIAKESLERQNTDLAQFSHIISHNLRGPVASALGLTQLFDRKNLANPVNSDILNRMVDSVRNIDTILKDISSILDIRENIPTEPDRFDAVSCINEVIQRVIRLHNDINTSWFSVRSEVTEIFGFKNYLEKILVHLIENAVQFREHSRTPEIIISIKKSAGHYEILVADNGSGIDPVDFEKIFQPFKKLTYDSPGRGLGLYQVKTMVHNLGGIITVDSSPGAGARFTVQIPVSDQD